MDTLLAIILSPNFLFSVIRMTTPILLAAMGALISDRAGVVNIGLEGMMLMSALSGVLFSAWSGSAWVGLIAAVLTGVLMAGILAYFTLEMRSHVILGGIALNLFASGGSVFILYLVTGDKGTSASLASKVLPSLHIPLIRDIPLVGEVVSGHHLITYLALACTVYVYVLLKRTALGRRIRAVGENPQAAESVGISVKRIQYFAVLMSGVFTGLAGAFLSMGYVSWFSRNMSAGRGWIAIAAEAMGRGNPIGTALTSLLFGVANALANALQVMNIPSELVGTIPYVATVIGLIVYAISETNAAKRKERL